LATSFAIKDCSFAIKSRFLPNLLGVIPSILDTISAVSICCCVGSLFTVVSPIILPSFAALFMSSAFFNEVNCGVTKSKALSNSCFLADSYIFSSNC
jgi:hypothetical protein